MQVRAHRIGKQARFYSRDGLVEVKTSPAKAHIKDNTLFLGGQHKRLQFPRFKVYDRVASWKLGIHMRIDIPRTEILRKKCLDGQRWMVVAAAKVHHDRHIRKSSSLDSPFNGNPAFVLKMRKLKANDIFFMSQGHL